MSEYEAIMKEREEELKRKSDFTGKVKSGEFETVEIGNIYAMIYVVGEKRKEAAE